MSLTIAPPPPPAGTPPPPAHQVVRFLDSLSGALDRLADAPLWSMSADEERGALVAIRRQRARLEELELRLLAQADRDQVGAESGATSTPAWLAHETKTGRAARFADLHLAEALADGFETTRAALAAGAIDSEKARIVINAVKTLTSEYDDLPPGTHQRAEAHMVDLAQRFDAAELRACGKRLFEVVCPEAADAEEGKKLAKEETKARAVAYYTSRDNGDGTSEGRFKLPTLHAHLLKKALEALTSPRRIGEGRIDPETGKKLPHATLLGHGLMDLLENHLSDLPSVNGSPFTLVVTVPLQVLMTGLGVATLDTGHRISAGEMRRLACQAGVIPMVLDGESVPLDLGREQRLFGRYQKLDINHRYGGRCAASNCDRTAAWLQYHHRKPWALGGETNAKDGIPFCPPHHHMADHPQHWDMTRQPDGTYRFHRRQ